MYTFGEAGATISDRSPLCHYCLRLRVHKSVEKIAHTSVVLPLFWHSLCGRLHLVAPLHLRTSQQCIASRDSKTICVQSQSPTLSG